MKFGQVVEKNSPNNLYESDFQNFDFFAQLYIACGENGHFHHKRCIIERKNQNFENLIPTNYLDYFSLQLGQISCF